MEEFFAALPSLAETIRAANLRPDKALGQHFLLDADLLSRLAAAAGDLSGVNVVEIGPGPGGLTRALLGTRAAHVTAIEYDARAVAALSPLAAAAGGRLTVVQGDAMRVDLPGMVAGPRAIVANLPYNVGSALLVRWLHEAAAYRSMTLMFQREVAERICAAPGRGAYGRLSVLTQWLCEAAIVAEVPAAAFTPAPKVDSALVHLVPRAVQPGAAALAAMERVTAAAFGQRRKMLRGALRGIGGEALLAAAGIDPQRRAETLSVGEFERLAGKEGQGSALDPLGAAPPDPH